MLRLLNRLRQQQIAVVTPPVGYTGAIKITVNCLMIDADLTDYTFILDQNFASVFTDTNGILDADGTNPMLADGGDVVVATTQDGLNKIPVDLRAGTTNNDTALAELEIACKLPFVGTSVDTTFYILWGGSETAQPLPNDTYGQYNAYDDDYVLVSPDGGDNDRTSYQHIGTPSGDIVVGGVAGLTGSATNYDGNDLVSFPYSPSLTFNDVDGDIPNTIEFTIVPNEISNYFTTPIAKGSSSDMEYKVVYGGGNMWAWVGDSDNEDNYASRPASVGVANQVALTFDALDLNYQHYSDGTVPTGISKYVSAYVRQRDTGTPLYFGGLAGSQYFSGTLSEVRFSKVVRSTSSISATNNNIRNTAGFLTITQTV